MRESTKAAVMATRIKIAAFIVSLMLAFATFMICRFAVGGEKLGFAPILTLFIGFFLSFGLFFVIIAIVTRSALTFLAGGIGLFIGTAFLMFSMIAVIPWFVTVIVLLIMAPSIFGVVYMMKAPVLALEFDNGPDSGRKTYAERKAEKEQAQKLAEAQKEAEKAEIKGEENE